MTTHQKFWKWFTQHESELFSFDSTQEDERERLFDELALELQSVHPDLTFEFGPNEAKREFVISAGGIQQAFPFVVQLANSAPTLDRWQVIAFRPRRSPVHSVEFQDKRINPEDVQFSLLDNGQKAGIHLFIPGYRDGDVALETIAYLLLDESLGEYDVECGLGLIKMLSPDVKTDLDRHPLAELPALFDSLVARLEKRSGQPS